MTDLAVRRTTFRDMIHRPDFQDALRQTLPAHVKPEKLVKAAMIATSRTPKLLDCTQQSLMQSIMQAASLGLDPSGTLGMGYLVPYGPNCTFIPGYRGLIDLARRGGAIKSLESRVVYANDEFEFEYGLTPKLKHVPCLNGEPGSLVFVYAVATLPDDTKQFEVMTVAQVDKVRKGSRAATSGPWVDHYDEMARKTVVRRITKYLPLSTELAEALVMEDDMEAGREVVASVTVEDATPIVDGLEEGTTKKLVAPQKDLPPADMAPHDPTDTQVSPPSAAPSTETAATPAQKKKLGQMIDDLIHAAGWDRATGLKRRIALELIAGTTDVSNASMGQVEAWIIKASDTSVEDIKTAIDA